MREIKFRAWSKKAGHFLDVPFTISDNGKTLAADFPTGNEDVDVRAEYATKEFELMQYTGLKDKNGKEIYEGDLVMSKSFDGMINPRSVIWNTVLGQWTAGETESLYAIGVGKGAAYLEVIGNIYENPVLRTGTYEDLSGHTHTRKYLKYDGWEKSL